MRPPSASARPGPMRFTCSAADVCHVAGLLGSGRALTLAEAEESAACLRSGSRVAGRMALRGIARYIGWAQRGLGLMARCPSPCACCPSRAEVPCAS